MNATAARLAAFRFRDARDDMRQQACSLLLCGRVIEAVRWARAAERVEEWRVQAWRRAYG